MAIAFDTSGNSGRSAAASASYSHACSGSNRILFAVTYSEGGNASNDVTAITYNGVAMTLAASSYASGQYGCNIYYLIAPATGANTLSATFSTTSSNHAILGLSYTGANQSGQPDATTTDRTNGNATLTLTTVADNSWAIIGEASGRDPTASTNVTARSDPGDGTFSGDTNGPKTPAGSLSMSVTEAIGGSAGRVMVSFSPAAGTAYTKTLTETATLGDILVKSTTRLLSEALTNTATFLGVIQHFKTVTEALTSTATLLKIPGKLLSESSTVIDSIVKAMTRSVSETASITATVLKTTGRSFTELSVSSDVFAFLKTKGRTLSETLTTADVLVRSLIRSLVEAQATSDTLGKTTGRSYSEFFSLSDFLIRVPARLLTEASAITDNLARQIGRAFSETTTVTASLFRTLIRSAVEVLFVIDVFARLLVVGRMLIETLSLNAVFTFLRNGSSILWTNLAKHTATLSTVAKHAATWINKPKS